MGVTFTLGLLFGLVGSIPIAGPLAAVAIKLGIERRFNVARTLTVGAGVGEGGYAYLAYWGVTGVVTAVSWLAPVAHAVAAALLLLFGVYFLRRGARIDPATKDDAPRQGGERRGFLLGLTIAGSNPALLASWSAAVAFMKGTGLVQLQQAHAPIFGLGAAAGVVCWFWAMIAIAERYRDRMVMHTLDRLVRITGGVLIALALGLGVRAVWRLTQLG